MARRNSSRVRPKNAGSTPKSKGKKFISKDKSELNEEAVRNSGNDPAWYASDPTILRDAASYPFSYNTGATEIHDSNLWPSSDFTQKPAEQIAGVCSLRVHPVVGTAHYPTDPINVAAQSVYSYVRHANSGSKNYDYPDLMLYILAMANMFSFLVWCQRIYGYALTYDQRNRYIPKDLIRTNNVNATDLINNLANFRFWINTLITKMVSFAVPATMSIFSRMSFLYRDYYIEGTSIKDQLYQYVPAGFYQFDLDSQQLGKLKWVPFNYSQLMTTADIVQYGETLFNAIWSQEDFGIMSGDILKAYGENNIIKVQPLPEAYFIVPKLDPMVLTQMKNADIIRADISDISQDPNDGTVLQAIIPLGYSTSDTWYGSVTALTSADATKANKFMMATLNDYRILTVDTDQPGPDIVIEATRLKVVYNQAKAWLVAGTELVESVVITTQPGTDVVVPAQVVTYCNAVGDAGYLGKVQVMLEASRNFHYMPRIWVGVYDTTGTKWYVTQRFDIDNFTLLTYEDVRKLHEAATINMLAVPSIGKVM